MSIDWEMIHMPSPSKEEIDSDLFNAIWEATRNWDISIGDGYCGRNGSHVKIILDAIKPVIRNDKIDKLIN